MVYKKKVRHGILLFLLCAFYVVYLFINKYGIFEYCLLSKRVEMMEAAVKDAEQQLLHLKDQLRAVKEDPFILEYSARHDLCLGYPNEYVYLLR